MNRVGIFQPDAVARRVYLKDLKTSIFATSWFLALQGLAYVEFADEKQASQAVLKLDGIDVEGNKITVAISNPPRRNPMDKPGSSRPMGDIMPHQVYGS